MDIVRYFKIREIINDMLIDGFNREIRYLRLSVTHRCNLRCLYCSASVRSQAKCHIETLSIKKLISIIQAAVGLGVDHLRITGGEPLLRRDIIELVREIRDIGSIKDLSLSTNGLLLAPLAKDLKAAGLDRVNISLDAMTPKRFEKITGGGDVKKVLQAIDAALEYGLQPVKVNVVIIKGINHDELTALTKLAKDRPVWVRFIELMPFCRKIVWDNDKVVGSQEIKARLSKIMELYPAGSTRGIGPASYYKALGYQGFIGFIDPYAEHFCDTCNRLRVTSDGRIKPCLFSEESIDLKPALVADNPSIQAIADLLYRAAMMKPRSHGLKERARLDSLDDMAYIGG